MQPIKTKNAEDIRLRLVFRDTVMFLNFTGKLTLGEIAQTLEGLSNQRYANPIAINATIHSAPERSA